VFRRHRRAHRVPEAYTLADSMLREMRREGGIRGRRAHSGISRYKGVKAKVRPIVLVIVFACHASADSTCVSVHTHCIFFTPANHLVTK